MNPLDGRGRGKNGRKRGKGNADWVNCPEEARLNLLEKLMGEVAIPAKSHHLGIQDVQWRNCVGLAGTAGLYRDEVLAVCQLT